MSKFAITVRNSRRPHSLIFRSILSKLPVFS